MTQTLRKEGDHINPYFLVFSVYALLITPISIHWSLRLGKKSGYRIKVQAAGLPFVRKRDENDDSDEQLILENEVAGALAHTDLTLVRAILDKGVRKRLLHATHLNSLYLHARVSMSDAAATALYFCAARTILETLFICKLMPQAMSGRVDADFNNIGTEVYISGIFSARLGSLGYTAILFSAAFIRARSKQSQPKEEAYAAPN